MKKIIIIISVILGIVAMGLGVYFAWQKTKTILTPPGIGQQPTASNQQSTTGEQQPAAAQKLKILSDQPIFDYWIFYPAATSTDSKIFYLSQDGKIFQLEGGKSEAVSSEPIGNIQMIKSSFDGKRVLIKFGDFISPKFIIFNTEAKVFELLPENITAAAFSPDAKKIAYLEKNSGNLMIKDLIGAKPKTVKVLSFNQKDFDLDWILAEKIVLTPKPSAFYRTSSWMIDINKKTLIALGTEVNGLMMKWSADGKAGLQFSSQSEGREGRLNLINEQGAVQAVLDFITLPDKCFISQPKIYCAVPESIPAKTVLPDDYLKRAVYFKDVFYQIDITQNSLSEILAGTEPTLDATRLNLVDNKLLFINRYDNGLYSLEL
ncbi:hypothetical protein GW816_02305 [Candidatus Wolfebacteria bacterium]|nr:hypothetical protein [Candidatus Wolfebacteria bacterium]